MKIEKNNHLKYSPISALRDTSSQIDKLLTDKSKLPAGIAVFAVGGYGREEVCAHSDIDILFLKRTAFTAADSAACHALLDSVWAHDNRKTGYAFRTLAENEAALVNDQTVLTAQLDARFLAGDKTLTDLLADQIDTYRNSTFADQFITAKLHETALRHTTVNHQAFWVEPDTKNGMGGLRDAQTVFWLQKFLKKQTGPAALEKAYAFILGLRNALHVAAGYAEDRLTFEMQTAIAPVLGYDDADSNAAVIRMMKDYFKAVRTVMASQTQFFASLNRQIGRLPSTPPAYALDVLYDDATDIDGLLLAGHLPVVIPQFETVTGLVQFDRYHKLTADAHMVDVFKQMRKMLSQSQPGDIAHDMAQSLATRHALLLAGLLHDMGKGAASGGQYVNGARMAAEICEAASVPADTAESFIWLTANHGLMSETAMTRDIDDPAIISQFARKVETLTRLKQLYLLTLADISAVEDGGTSAWKQGLLDGLYARTADAMTSGNTRAAANINATFDMNDINKSGFSLKLERGKGDGVTRLSVAAVDRKGLFADIAGCISLSGGNILSAHVTTTTDGIAIDSFAVKGINGGDFENIEMLRRNLRRCLHDETLDLPTELKSQMQRKHKRKAATDMSTTVDIDYTLSAHQTYIGIHTLDSPGLLYRIARCLSDHGAQISSAHIDTTGDIVRDGFYIKDRFGLKITNDVYLTELADHLRALPGLAAGIKK